MQAAISCKESRAPNISWSRTSSLKGAMRLVESASRETPSTIDRPVGNKTSAWWLIDWLIDLRPCQHITAILWTAGHRLRSTPTNGHRFTAPGLPYSRHRADTDVKWIKPKSVAVTHPSTNRVRRYLTSVTESPSRHWSPRRTYTCSGLNYCLDFSRIRFVHVYI